MVFKEIPGPYAEYLQGKEDLSMALEKELETYKKKLPELKENDEGKFALIHGDDVVGVFVAYEDAVKSGYETFKLEPFLVKKIEAIEAVQFISRFADPCSSSRAS